ncbi:metallophosphoesterase [Clostridium sp. CF012]|uniref:metallophosphoesterase n=1 Tax=Clostridium sp. CF012 TaxID=2843319 RepID=UPI001C0DA0DC|nr:metallophosphoesterase [Clostridium sp. CF012]MBU3146264.1 metallophosphoesterase [Clostridium sp. CF012]
MKKYLVLLITLLTFILPTVAFAEVNPVVQPTLVMKTSTTLANNADNPVVVSSTNSLLLDFGTILDGNTVTNAVKVFKVSTKGLETEVPVNSVIDKINPSILQIKTKDSVPFTQGEEFKIVVSPELKSSKGLSLSNNIEYFAVNYSFTLAKEGIAQLDSKRELVVCISDIHLGIDDKYAEIKKNREDLKKFLEQIRYSPNVKELVIAGDLFDEWFIPAQLDTFNGKTQLDFIKLIAKNNKTIIDAFNNIITDKKIKVTYVPGNHDLLFTASDVQSVLPGISQARDVQGLGAYSPENFPKAVIEHGHRYNFFCAPDPISNAKIAPGSILPPGYFFTRIATTSVIEGHPKAGGIMPEVTPNNIGVSQDLAYSYWQQWKGLMTALPAKESFDEKFITTNIDGFKEDYSINEIMPYQTMKNGAINVNLFKGSQDSWEARQTLNKVPIKTSVKNAITNGGLASDSDEMSNIQYFSNPNSDKRIVVFGHTHEARILSYNTVNNQKAIYANSGTWIDKNTYPTMTFVVLIPQKTKYSMPSFVNLYQYSSEGVSTKLDAQALTKLNN